MTDTNKCENECRYKNCFMRGDITRTIACQKELDEESVNGAKPALCDVLEEWRKDNGLSKDDLGYKDLCIILAEYFA